VPEEQLIPFVAVAVALPLVLLRNRRARTLRLKWLWVTPLLVAVLIGFGLWGMSFSDPGQAPFRPADWALLAVGLGLGAVAGWWRGKTVVIHRDPAGVLKAQASPVGLILIVALLLGRRALGAWLEPHAADWGLNVVAVHDAFMLFAAGLVVAQRVEIFIRARRIVAGGDDSRVVADA